MDGQRQTVEIAMPLIKYSQRTRWPRRVECCQLRRTARQRISFTAKRITKCGKYGSARASNYCFRVARRMSRTSFSGVPAVESDFCLMFAPWRLR
jgi:hypothetical protein